MDQLWEETRTCLLDSRAHSTEKPAAECMGRGKPLKKRSLTRVLEFFKIFFTLPSENIPEIPAYHYKGS